MVGSPKNLVERNRTMNYSDGQIAHLGDDVLLGSEPGRVVASIDTDEYDSPESKMQWSYLSRGVLIAFKTLGLIHYEAAEPDLSLVRRR